MSATTSTPWLDERPDRSGLICWLIVAEHRSRFLREMLAALLQSGRLSDAQETALRRSRARSMLVADRGRPERAGRNAGVA